MRILVAEDDTALATFVKKGLEAEHYAVDVSGDGEQARAMAGEFDFDLVVLDLTLPRLDGVAILRYLRTRKPSMPVLVLTGRSRVEDRVQCLDLGADDYLIKPFSFSELSARIRALLRRCHLPAESVLTVEDLKLDRVERRVERAGRRIELTSKEFALLEYLMRNAGRRITRAMIIEHVWNLSFDTATNVVDVYINYKTMQVLFRDLFYQTMGSSGAGDPIQLGAGVAVSCMPSMFTQGNVDPTGVATDVAINDAGFFIVSKGGFITYTRGGNFSKDQNGYLVTPEGQQVLGYPAVNGTISTGQGLTPLQLSTGTMSPPTPTSIVQLRTNLNAAADVGSAEGTYSTPITIYDSLGGSHVLTFNFTKTGSNAWDYSITIPAADVGQTGNPVVLNSGSLVFDSNGNLTTPAADVSNIAISGLADGAANMTFTWDLYDAGAPVLTQVAAPNSTSSTQQDGSGSGTLSSFAIGSDGTITGSFSNGKTAMLGQLALATFANEQGLSRTGKNGFSETLASGQAVIGVPGTGGRGTLAGGALELSNVDIAKEFAALIIAQRGFQANARAVTTFDEITQETINLKR